jgi:hypothetical protein
MQDNFDLISSVLNFSSPEDFYFIQILKRRKDNPDMKRDVSVMDNFFISSLEDLEKSKDKIIGISTYHNARATIRLNKRNTEKIALQSLKITTDCIINKDYKGVKNAYLSACGQYSSDENKTWIVDIDDKSMLDEIITHLQSINVKIKLQIPTKSGIHLIVSPFNPNLFSSKYPTVDLHKDNSTILYCT